MPPMLLRWLILLFSAGFLACVGNAEEAEKSDMKNAVAEDSLAQFTWNTELCAVKGTYDPQKYSLERIENTYKLWTDDWTLETQAVASTPEEVSRLSVEKLTAEYDAVQADLVKLTPVSGAYWQSVKTQKLSALDAEFKFKKVAIMAYSAPEVLLQGASPECKVYTEALVHADTALMLHTWARLVDEQKARNGLPEQLAADYERKLNSSDKLKYAQIELMAFGWWNCVNKRIPYVVRDEQMEKAFNKLFVRTESQCDEP
jgi:hypothetical protein